MFGMLFNDPKTDGKGLGMLIFGGSKLPEKGGIGL